MNPIQAVRHMSPQDMAMNMLKNMNPQGYQKLQELMHSGQNPDAIANQMLSKLSGPQKQQLQQFAAQFIKPNGF